MQLIRTHRRATAAMIAACLWATAPTAWAEEKLDDNVPQNVQPAVEVDTTETDTTGTDTTETDTTVQACTDAWEDADANDVCSVGTTSRNASDATEDPGACVLKQVKCILSAIKIKETSYVMNFQVDEDTVTKSVDDTDDLDVCIKGNADYTGDPGVNSYEATLKSGCAADETGSSTATSEGIPATQYFIDEEKKLQNPGSNQSDSNTGQTPSPTTGNAANNAECTSRWDQAPASTYCKATATYKTGTIWGMSGGTFHCELSAVDCSITVTIDEGRDGAITETDYTLTHSNAGPVSYAPDKLSRLLLCVLLDFNEPTSGYKATLPVAVNAPACNQMGVGGYDQNWVENYNLPEVHTEDD